MADEPVGNLSGIAHPVKPASDPNKMLSPGTVITLANGIQYQLVRKSEKYSVWEIVSSPSS